MRKSKAAMLSHISILSIVSITRRFGAISLCSCSFVTCSAAALDLPDVTITGLTHTFGHFGPGGPTTLVRDAPAPGQFIQSSFSAMLTGSETITLRFEAPVGYKFVIHAPPSGYGTPSLIVGGQWWDSTPAGLGSPVATSFTFDNLVGSQPVRNSSFDRMSQRLVMFSDVFYVTPGTEFTAIELSATYSFNFSNPSTRNFVFVPDNFAFQCQVTSLQILGNGTLMTLEAIPEPTAITLMLASIGLFALWSNKPRRVGFVSRMF